jgi:hypothetical protein
MARVRPLSQALLAPRDRVFNLARQRVPDIVVEPEQSDL